MDITETNLSHDVEIIGRIKIVPTILSIICRSTGMGFAAIARVTDKKWIACEVRDEIRFGLMPGGELTLDTTICNEIRLSGNPVVIDHVREDESYCNHHTPQMYGFQSYISVPILDAGGHFFGTLCAIDPKPTLLNNTEIVGMFKVYAALISFYLTVENQILTGEMRLVEDMIFVELDALLKSLGEKEAIAPARRDLDLSTMIYQSTYAIRNLTSNLRVAHETMQQQKVREEGL